ncbi:alpha/beta hydrolase-fold protein, partial [Rhizobium johnstonii]|uniref:alpha/beta hydrolase-fold protein n=1 Tax=Rhizobium johnstonii TaxID=3019933 RepID=UPI003F9C5F59
CDMTFAFFLPPQAKARKLPVLWYLSGLTCTLAELPIISFVRDGIAPRTGVGAEDDDAKFCGKTPILALFHDVGMGA